MKQWASADQTPFISQRENETTPTSASPQLESWLHLQCTQELVTPSPTNQLCRESVNNEEKPREASMCGVIDIKQLQCTVCVNFNNQ